jgi:long-chain fatty acid transport protein
MTERSGMGKRLTWATAVGLAIAAACPQQAHAGGFEEPGIGTEAMGRGGAFAAKADDGTALEYNIAGLARQRGTRITIEGKLTLNHDEFTRTGKYPTIAGQAWSGQAYPTVSSNNVSAAPFLAISTDFNYFERWTFAIGLNTPSASAQNRKYPSTVNGTWPSPQRYDATDVNLLVVYPMLAAAVRVTKWLDIGLALQMVYGTFDLKASAYADLGNSLCITQGNSACDANLHIKTSAFSATGVLGFMAHPTEDLSLGLNLRGPMYLDSSGTITATPPTAAPIPINPGTAANPAKAQLDEKLPWILRFGARYAFHDKKHREQGDIEADGTYETWHEAEGNGDTLKVKNLGPPVAAPLTTTLLHHYKDTGSVRVGGAYNFWFANETFLALRLGIFYDSAATSNAWTRIDFDTLPKIGYALGLGYKIHGVSINVAYNYIASNSRTVDNGKEHVINGITGKAYGPDGYEPVFNNGTYSAHTQAIFVGLGFNIDEIRHKQRTLTY